MYHVQGSTQELCEVCEKRTLHWLLKVGGLMVLECVICKLRTALEKVAHE